MSFDFEHISKNNRYGYARVSSREQAENSFLKSQKAKLVKLGGLEENTSREIGSATNFNKDCDFIMDERFTITYFNWILNTSHIIIVN